MKTAERLRDALISGNAVIVAGSGVTASLTQGAPTSTWAGLLENGIAHAENRPGDNGPLLRLRLENATAAEDLVGIAQDVKRHVEPDFGRWLTNALGDLKPVAPNLALAMQKLDLPILTTNYDNLLEQVMRVPSATWSQPDEMRAVLLRESNAVGHLHGMWRDPESVIFSDGDYNRVIQDEIAQQVQTSAFTLKTFVFIGCGAGLEDPNFSPMVKRFSQGFPGSANTHFRLCLNDEVDASTELKSVVDVGYGSDFDDLAAFLTELAESIASVAPPVDVSSSSRAQILDQLRDNSTLWRDADSLSSKTFTELVIPPILLPEPHDQYATNAVVNAEKDRPEPVGITDLLSGTGIVIIAGEENSGVSTAISWSLHEALNQRQGSHAILVDEPLVAGHSPVKKVVDRKYREWGLEGEEGKIRDAGTLGVDNLRFEDSDRFRRAVSDIATSPLRLKIVGVRQEDVVEVVNALKEITTQEVRVVYLGRFSQAQALELARRVAPGREESVAKSVMIIIRKKNLPRTPFTITLLVELVQSGLLLQKEESETAVLDQYINLLLSGEFIRSRGRRGMTLRQKRLVLESLARRFVERREDKAPQAQVLDWLSHQFSELGWNFDVLGCITDLIDRRVLALGTDNTLRFQRSAYLELMAGIAAKDDQKFRQLVFAAPIQLASIVRTYAAMTRNDTEVLELVEKQVDRIAVGPLLGSVFGSVRRLEAGKDLFSDNAESESSPSSAESNGDAVERDGISKVYYDDSDDSDTPAFLTSRVEDLSQARLAMLVVDLASRVLRDSDEVRDQKLKGRILEKILVGWVTFTDLYETQLAAAPELDEAIIAFHQGEELAEEDFEGMKAALLQLMPSFLTLSGIRYCLSAPSLVTRLAALDFSGVANGSYAAIMRSLALYGVGTNEWIDSLRSIDDRAIKSFFSASFLASLARFSYITDDRLSDEQRDRVRDFLRRVITERYNFKNIGDKNSALNRFETKLRGSRLAEGRRTNDRLAAVGE